MTSILKVDTIQDTAGNNIINESSDTITIGASGDTITIPSGATISNLGTASGFGGTNTPAFFAYQSSAQSISNNTGTIVNFQTEEFDTDSAFASNRFTVPTGKGGKYFFYFAVRKDNFSVGRFNAELILNGSVGSGLGENGSGGVYDSVNVSVVLDLSAGDYVEVSTFQNSGTTQNLLASKSWTFFGGYKIIE